MRNIPGRERAVPALLILAVMALADPWRSGGLFWDFGNALGFLALAGLLFQMIPGPRGTPRPHELLGYWVLAIAGLHAFWFLAGDAVARFYLLPGGPLHMWLGLAGLLLLAGLSILARMPDRRRLHPSYRGFRRLHRHLALACLAATLLHVLLSGFYLPLWWQAAALAAIALACAFGRRIWPRASAVPVAAWLGAGGGAVAVFVLMREVMP
ncbi:hypothetical protein GCM10007291_45490 [Gemmobacter nanjingensis]|uniref:Ferric reductase like transmembrane component n=1 Tax=Gemmobacter nanjingensis TaxID=488454 RepID=A0ABQ3FSV5_9RHOB|nr:hypothetical protein [Gemmobacter nanjingensis]GHC38737.1 hypothetical protein GCM10007291_45490 [Gemmobacter nanjingensis]